VAQDAAADEEEAQRLASRAEADVHGSRPRLVRLAGEAAVDQAVIPVGPDGIAHAVTVAEGRRRAAEQVRRLADVAASAKATAARADEQAARSEQELATAQAAADDADDLCVAESRTWRDAVRAWPGAAGLGLLVPSWEPMHRRLGEGAADADELAAIPALARTLLEPVVERARGAEATARAAVSEAERALGEKERERAALEAQGEARPPVPRYRSAERDERAGAPFYELVDVAPHVGAAERAGLEAALEASGLLDAWVAHDGLVVHPATQDVVLRADATALPAGVPTLADVLVADRPHVQRLLRAVGWGDQGAHPWVAADGRWSLGPLRGAWAKPASEYLGARTRRQTRAEAGGAGAAVRRAPGSGRRRGAGGGRRCAGA
jgi:hypothetical protein